jgi:L-2-hydroxyglutarate oxidase LhgO
MTAYHVAQELPKSTDFLIVGAGVVGLSLALQLRDRYPKAGITVVEKEQDVGAHASGRNSGVLHAGFYYSADSLKAQLCREGNARMQAWCEEHRVPIRKCGKLVVTRREGDTARLHELKRRGDQNGVPLQLVSQAEAQRIEPRARTTGEALFSPTSAVVSPMHVMESLAREAARRDVRLVFNTAWLRQHDTRSETTRGTIQSGFLVNAAGLQAVRIAHSLGLARDYVMLPFKGRYLCGDDSAKKLAVHVYPVPDLDLPFLGVHLTVTIDGGSKIGPTASPAWWLENYADVGARGFFERFSGVEMASVLREQGRLFFRHPLFRRHALREPLNGFRRSLLAEASTLVNGIEATHFRRWGRPGIRAQLVDRRRAELVMDFCLEQGRRSLHVLNAVSPGFTCAFSFAERLADTIDEAQRADH